jgi:hypothetical protein
MTTATSEITVRQPQDDALMAMPLLSIDQMIARRTAIVEITRKLLKVDHDFGTIPGTQKKNEDGTPSSKNHTLLKPGAEKLCSLFGLVPEFDDYRVTEDWDRGLFYYAYVCRLTRNGRTVASGIGSANSREKKYRRGARACPECGAPTIKRSKYPPRDAAQGTPPGWYCHEKAGGCGRQFAADDQRILESGATVDPAESCDLINTLQKMAQKRALVAATLIATNASEFFTQDVEDMEVTRDGGDVVEGEIVEPKGQQQRRPANGNGARKVVNEQTGEVIEEDAPDLMNDAVFMAKWHETLKVRGWTLEEGETVMKDQLAQRNWTLQQVNLDGRRGLLHKAKQGKYDAHRDAIRARAKQQQQAKGQASTSAATVDPKAAEKEVESYETFLALARAAAKDVMAVPADRFDRGISLALMKIGKAGKGETAPRPWRAQQLAAIRAGAFDFETGTINQVAQAIA